MGTSTGTPAQPEAGPGKRSGREVSRDAPGDAGAGSRGPRPPRSRPRGRTHAGRTRRPARCHWRRLAAPPGGAGEGSRGARRREGGRERQRARGEALSAERGGKHWAAASTGRRHTQYGAWRRARTSSCGCDKEGSALRGGGAGRRVGVAREAGVAAVSYPGDGARDRRTGVRRGGYDQPFRLGEHPCCVDPVDPALRPGHGAQRRYRKGDTISGGLPPLSGQGLGLPSK